MLIAHTQDNSLNSSDQNNVKMTLQDLSPTLRSPIILETKNGREAFQAIAGIPLSFWKDRIVSIHAEGDSLVLRLEEQTPIKSLEELGYSFETGV